MPQHIEETSYILQYHFSNKELLREALTHPSTRKKHGDQSFSYERLEFLGDAVLNCVIAEYLFRQYPHLSEGILSKMQAQLISRKTCAKLGKQIDLGQLLVLSEGEERNNGRQSDTNIANAMEAVIGAIFLDDDMDAARSFILKLWQELCDAVTIDTDYKTILQEWAQSRYRTIPQYTITQTTGPKHNLIFEIQVTLPNLPPCTGCGENKKAAAQVAAFNMLKIIRG